MADTEQKIGLEFLASTACLHVQAMTGFCVEEKQIIGTALAIGRGLGLPDHMDKDEASTALPRLVDRLCARVAEDFGFATYRGLPDTPRGPTEGEAMICGVHFQIVSQGVLATMPDGRTQSCSMAEMKAALIALLGQELEK